MTTLNGNVSDSATVIVVTPGSEQENGFRFRIDDEILTFLGYDRDSTADIVGYLGGARTRWRVRRGEEGTTAASHLSGATLYAVAEAFATSEDLTAPSPFAAGGVTPTLAEVLAEGNDPNGALIQGADNGANVGAAVEIQGASGSSGGNVNISSGPFDGGTKTGAALFVNGGYAESDGFVAISTFNSSGNLGDVLVNDDSQGSGGLRWGRLPNSAEIVVTEDASGAAGTYSGSITVPGGATITGIGVTPIANWSSNIAVLIQIGVEGELGRYLEDGPGGFTLGTTTWDTGDGLGSFSNSGVGWYSDTDNELLVTVTVSDTNPPGTGILRVLVTWSLPPSSAATFEAAA